MNRITGEYEDKVFKDVIDYLEPGDVLVRNDTKVIPARLYGTKSTGAKVEFVLLKRLEGDTWEVMCRPGNKLHEGAIVNFGEEGKDPLLTAEIIGLMEDGTRKVKFSYSGIFNEILDQIGLMPLLHFTEDLFKKIEAKGIEVANVTLHVGIGTFRPVKEKNVEDHHMHEEHYLLKEEDAIKINRAKDIGHRVICVGTTSCRTIETIADETGHVKAQDGNTSIYIYGLITNFHLPKSTLVMLVSAFSTRENVLNAYKHAVEEKYRFFSFGDAMLII